MRKTYIPIVMMILVALFCSCDILVAEQTQRDMFVSVVIQPTFKLTLNNANINFGYTEPGKTVELYPANNYNEVKCTSNKGSQWYLKLSIMGTVSGPTGSSVALDSFKWMIMRSSGDGIIEEGWHPFTDTPVIGYTSGVMDMTGEEITIALKYKLDLPQNATGGNYNVNVMYTMTETP